MDAFANVIAAFSEDQVEKLTKVTKGRLRYWDKTGFYRPSYAEENRRVAFSRIYSFKDIVALKVLYVLRSQYRTSLQHLREVSSKLAHLGADPDRWVTTRLYPLNGRVYWLEGDAARDVLSGQYVACIALEDVVEAMRGAVANIRELRDASKVGHVEKSRYVMRNAPVLAGTRIPVGAIKRFHAAGYSVEQILKEYPDITASDVAAALEYRDASAAA